MAAITGHEVAARMVTPITKNLVQIRRLEVAAPHRAVVDRRSLVNSGWGWVLRLASWLLLLHRGSFIVGL